jgi:glucose/arabinose dehydrogenase
MPRWTLLLALLALLAFAAGCGDDDDSNSEEEFNPFGLEKQLVAEAPDPVALTFAPDGRLFFAEKYTGNIRIVSADGTLLSEPFASIEVATWLGYQGTDWGLTGLALDPAFESNGYLYALYTETVTESDTRPTAKPVLVRFTADDNVGTDRTVIIGDFPETRLDHQGFKANGALHLGPDGVLYVSMGDYDWGKDGPRGTGAAQDLSFAGGKLLRVDTNGQAPSDNPLADNEGADPRIFAYGFSSPFEFAFHPTTGDVYGTDSTDSCEELNLILPASNYGYPDIGDFPYPDCTFGTQIPGIHFFARPEMQAGEFQSVVGVKGLEFVSGSEYPGLGDGLLVCESVTGFLRRLILAGPNFDQVTGDDVVVDDCAQDVTVSPDGTIYYSNKTSIQRLIPPPTAPPTSDAVTPSATP